MTKIISYNVNGIRSAIDKGLIEWIKDENPEILCFQELKANSTQFNLSSFEQLGYNTYWFSAKKPGYSGVGIISKQKPDNVVYGMEIKKYDDEGRFLRLDFGDLSVISVYHPSGSSGDDRQLFKIQWLADFTSYINELKKTRPKLIICGDYNICRLWIDIHNPEKQIGTSGFLPEERQWFQEFVDRGFIDTFRYIYPDKTDIYSWWSFRAGSRPRNKGWRIDYNIVSENLKNKIIETSILTEVKHSDHCPVLLVVDI